MIYSFSQKLRRFGLSLTLMVAFAASPSAGYALQLAFENQRPYIAVTKMPATVKTGEASQFKFYVTDFKNKDYRLSKPERLTVSFWINGVHYQDRVVKGGEHSITFPAIATPTRCVLIKMQATDKEGRKSHLLHHEYRVVDPATLEISAPETYSPTATDLLTDFGIYNDNTNPAPTTEGLNAMLEWARTNGYRKVILPLGVYRIDENSQVSMRDQLTLDLNGSTLKMNPNALATAQIIQFAHCYDSHLLNGIVEGEWDQHDFSLSAYSEHVLGIVMGKGSEYCSVRNVLVHNITGSGVVLRISYPTKPSSESIPHDVQKNPGAFNLGAVNPTTGVVVSSTTQTVSATAVDISSFVNSLGYFQLGVYLAYQGNPTDNWNYMASYYDATNNYIGSQEGYLYRKLYPPANAKFARFTLASPVVLTSGRLQVYNMRPPLNCEIKDVWIKDVRCVGLVPSGFNNLEVSGVTIENSGSALAKCAFDAEDGWDLMQDLYFHDNVFVSNPNTDFAMFAGLNFVIENNQMGLLGRSRVHGMIVRNNQLTSANIRVHQYSRPGHVMFYNNEISGLTTMQIEGTPADYDRDYRLKNNVHTGGVKRILVDDANTGEHFLVYRGEVRGLMVGRALESDIVNVNNPSGTFEIYDSYLANSYLLSSTPHPNAKSIIANSDIVDTGFRIHTTGLDLIGNNIAITTGSHTILTSNWVSSLYANIIGNTITTSGTAFLFVQNDFDRIVFSNNTVNSTATNFGAITLSNPNVNALHTAHLMTVSMSGNTFNGNGGFALKVVSVPKATINLRLGLGNNTLNSIAETTTNIVPLSHVTFGLAPTVSITSPLNGTSAFEPLSVTISASASDVDGMIDQVSFCSLDKELGADPSSPYSLSVADLPANNYYLFAKAADNQGFTGVSTLTNLQVDETITKEGLFVSGTSTLTTIENALKNQMENLGYTVTVIDDDIVTLADAGGKDVVFISATVSATLGGMFKDCATPIICANANLYSSLGMTGATSGVDYGEDSGQTSINVLSSGHPIADGLSGTVAFSTSTSSQSWGVPLASGLVVATQSGAPSKPVLFAYDVDALLAGFYSPARRVAFPSVSPGLLTSNGYLLFEAAIQWAAGDL